VASIGGFPHLEQPVVADVDADGHAEIVVSSSNASGCYGAEEYTMTARVEMGPGLFVLGDPDSRWASTRRVWNQHTYHVTNIEEGGAVPANEANSWETYNNYRQNVPRP